MAGYTRQTTFVDAATIEAADHNNELNQVEIAFNNTTGHAHDGTVAEGPVIGIIGDAGLTTPLNKVLVDTASNRLEFWIDVASSSTEQVYIADGVMAPTTDSDVDLGTNTERFKSLYVDDITVTDTATTKTNLGITDVTLAGTPDYLTLSGQEITLNQIDLTTDVTGVLPSANTGVKVKPGHIRLTASTGNQALTGLGFEPSWIMVVQIVPTGGAGEIITASGYYVDSTYFHRSRTAYNDGSTVAFLQQVGTNELYDVYNSFASNRAAGVVFSFDSDGFTINKTSATIEIDLFFLAGT